MCLKPVYKHDVQDQSVTWLRLDCLNPSSLALKAEMCGIRLVDAYMKGNYRCICQRHLYSLLSFQRTGSTTRSKREPKSHEIVLMHLSGDYLNRNAENRYCAMPKGEKFQGEIQERWH